MIFAARCFMCNGLVFGRVGLASRLSAHGVVCGPCLDVCVEVTMRNLANALRQEAMRARANPPPKVNGASR